MATSRRLHVLITNDDGIESPGLWALAAGARRAGLDVTVAAPHVDASGASASMMAERDAEWSVRVHRRELAELPGVPAYAVEGHPAFIVAQACRGWLDPLPDLVLSGINLGANTGRAILHSGTVGAALTASLFGVRALAVSLNTPWQAPEHPHWDTAVAVLPQVLEILLAAPAATVLSLNVPDLPASEIGPLREATLADFGTVEVRVAERDGDGGTRLHPQVVTQRDAPADGTDLALLRAGHPTVTEIRSVAAVPGLLPVSSRTP